MSRPWILVSPSSRGIGAHLVKHLLRTTGAPILATSRSPDTTSAKHRLLESLALPSMETEDLASRLKVVRLDVTDESTIAAAAEEARGLFPAETHHLRLALAIPGILHPEKSPGQVEYEKALDTFRVNTLGQMMLMKHFSPFLPRKAASLPPSPSEDARGLPPGHAVWAAMSARVGSTSDNLKGGWYSYRASKAGVTSLAKSLDLWLRARSGDKAIAVAYHPGTVKTGLSEGFWNTVPKEKLFEPEFAVERMCKVLTEEVGVEGRGRFWDWQGKEILP
ncbi:short-chain dehydrogenase/reductase [Colletotrichum tofieldiae]|uniref:Short-chain dehydrogenase/reductase (Oxidoreductase) n=1 Tax=Colletotrichum tofieldiae TaxID=708197 RepID=A0A166PZF4_9PEZI|nr:short-chain dehydrogenase/reductase (oxidoreductase) [Colletotrichum tofieldiae]GKT62477.1 short-chain dehydrogenase/reductase [Colletotrichum tofieldiae]GKT69477.1 short-chain dehydrogenase/reductase [Colletotrichum tofieldiae]GKT96217.1 short-chain dehydrogenase/reductase [Colletotrichum tofieldiae]